jgi:hypothetical protein
VAVAPEPVKQDLIDNEILESVPKTMKAKVQLLLKQMKSSPDISWHEKGELKYKGETVQGSNVVDLVNDVLRKRKYFNPQGWEPFGETLREANVSQDLIGHEDRWRYISQTFCSLVNGTLPLKILLAHSHRQSTRLPSAFVMRCLRIHGFVFCKYNISLPCIFKR